jgi:luciferase-like monooxygenase
VNVGVRLPRQFEDSGDYLADARALESAGADSLWLDDEGHDPWLLLAGIATITGRIRLIAPISSAELRASEDLGAKIATLSRLSRGRLVLTVGGTLESPAAVDGVMALARRSQCCVLLDSSSDRRVGLADGVVGFSESPERFRAAIEPLTKLREREKLTGPFERWAAIKMPDDRESWRRLRGDYEHAGATGLIVPADPRLLDLLRNGDEEEDRSDLGLAQG